MAVSDQSGLPPKYISVKNLPIMADLMRPIYCPAGAGAGAAAMLVRPRTMKRWSVIRQSPARINIDVSYRRTASARITCSTTDCISSRPVLGRLQLPYSINCLFPVHCHPEYESIREECDQWGLSMFGPGCRDAVRLPYLNGLYPLFVASTYPSAISKERLELLTKFYIWLALLDDTTDMCDEQTAREIVTDVVAVLQSTSSAVPTYTTRDPCVHKFMERFRVEVWEQMCRGMSPNLQSRLVAQILTSMEAMEKMWHLRRQRTASCEGAPNRDNLENVMAMRILDGWCWPSLILVEYGLGIDLPDAARKTPRGKLVRNIEEAVCKQLVLVNDLFSLTKEIHTREDTQSILGCLAAQRGIASRPVEVMLANADAMREIFCQVWEMIEEQERIAADILHQIRAMPASASAHDELHVPGHTLWLSYAEEVCLAMSGNFYWSTRTWRFNGPHPIPWNSTTPPYLIISDSPLVSLNVL